MEIVAFSDTHGEHRIMDREDVPDGDVLIHAADMTKHGKVNELRDFLDWFSEFPHRYKIIVAGNHDFCFTGAERQEALNLVHDSDIAYLEDDYITVEDLTFFGTPFSNTFDRYVFNEEMPEIQDEVDVLITHGPPKGVLDHLDGWGHIGSEEISEMKEKLDLQAHVFGHVHSYNGREKDCFNVSVLNEDYELTGEALKVEI